VTCLGLQRTFALHNGSLMSGNAGGPTSKRPSRRVEEGDSGAAPLKAIHASRPPSSLMSRYEFRHGAECS
jgi:hypothetical protein